jgi:4-methyl-5(b-hydroxyethyl)-thiazole monophosphate biosynthesis
MVTPIVFNDQTARPNKTIVRGLTMSKTVLVPIADGSEDIEAVTIIDILRRAGAEVTVASVDGLQVTMSRGIRITADALITDCADRTYDLIALPGGIPGAEHLRDSDVLTDLLKSQHREGRLYAAICASPAVVLTHHGLLQGKHAACYPSFADQLENREAADRAVVEDGQAITSRGVGTAIPFALKLAEKLFGADKAREVAESIVFR